MTTTIIPVPTLSTQGLVYDPANKFDSLMAHIFAADANETVLYKGHIFSLSQAIQSGGGDAIRVENALREHFHAYLSRYYDQVTVQITVSEIDNSSSRLDFSIYIEITDGLSITRYSRLIKTVNKKLQQILDLNNYGIAPQ